MCSKCIQTYEDSFFINCTTEASQRIILTVVFDLYDILYNSKQQEDSHPHKVQSVTIPYIGTAPKIDMDISLRFLHIDIL